MSKRPIEITLDVEQLIYEVNTFLNAASMMQPPRQELIEASLGPPLALPASAGGLRGA